MTPTNTKTPTSKTEPTTKPKRKINRRTPDQIVADLEKEIERVKARAAAKQVKQSDEGKAFLAAVKAVDKAIKVAGDAKDQAMVRALESARAELAKHAVVMGVRLK